MKTSIKNTEKYERNGRPALPRPDLKPPKGWSLELINSVNLIHHHRLSPDGQTLAYCWQRDGETNIYTVPADGCASYTETYRALSALEADTHLHVHKENNVLFPTVEARTSAGARA